MFWRVKCGIPIMSRIWIVYLKNSSFGYIEILYSILVIFVMHIYFFWKVDLNLSHVLDEIFIFKFTFRTHLMKQWAAVRIHWLLMIEPPQWCLRRNNFTCKLTCHGHSPGEESVPPTILIFLAECCMHTTEIIGNCA